MTKGIISKYVCVTSTVYKDKNGTRSESEVSIKTLYFVDLLNGSHPVRTLLNLLDLPSTLTSKCVGEGSNGLNRIEPPFFHENTITHPPSS